MYDPREDTDSEVNVNPPEEEPPTVTPTHGHGTAPTWSVWVRPRLSMNGPDLYATGLTRQQVKDRISGIMDDWTTFEVVMEEDHNA